jgi:1,2-diacylglycerol 3-beta-glucosyltransferase
VFSVLSAISTLLLVMFLAYVAFILVPFLRYPKAKTGSPADFDWHFLIPCRDEAAVIATTIERARGDFPTAHVWVIDDDSDDDTSSIANRYAATDPFVHVVQRRRPAARIGKGDALNAGYRALNAWLPADANRSRVIVNVVDADGEVAANALEVVSSADVFGDETIGAAQISVWMKNRDDRMPIADKGRMSNMIGRWLLRMQDIEFRTIIAGMQSLRARTGTVGLGGNGQFTRLDVLDRIAARLGEPWHGALLEDYELGVHVLLAGSKIKHVYDTHVSQEALPSMRRLLTQRTRWAQGNIQCVKYLPEVVRSDQFDAAGVLETSYYLVLPFLQLLGILTLIGGAVGQVIGAIQDPILFATQLTNSWGNMALIVLFSIAPFFVWGPVYKKRCEPTASWGRAALWGLGVWLYVFYMYPVLIRAFARILTGRSGWSKTRRNAEAPILQRGLVAIES